MRIAVVDDEAVLRRVICTVLKSRKGFHCLPAEDAKAAWELIRRDEADLLLLDWMLPGASGLELLQRIRRDPQYGRLPVIMLTAKGDEASRVEGLNNGADDYIAKPFSNRELIARIEALMRRHGDRWEEIVLREGNWELRGESRQLLIDGVDRQLRPREFALMRCFIANPHRVFSRRQLLAKAWGGSDFADAGTVNVHISRLRQALANGGRDCSAAIETVRGGGYRFVPD